MCKCFPIACKGRTGVTVYDVRDFPVCQHLDGGAHLLSAAEAQHDSRQNRKY